MNKALYNLHVAEVVLFPKLQTCLISGWSNVATPVSNKTNQPRFVSANYIVLEFRVRRTCCSFKARKCQFYLNLALKICLVILVSSALEKMPPNADCVGVCHVCAQLFVLATVYILLAANYYMYLIIIQCNVPPNLWNYTLHVHFNGICLCLKLSIKSGKIEIRAFNRLKCCNIVWKNILIWILMGESYSELV